MECDPVINSLQRMVRLGPRLKSRIVFACFLVMCFLVYNYFIVRQSNLGNCNPHKTNPREIVSSDIDLNELWSFTVEIHYFLPYPPIALTTNALFVAQSCNQIIAFLPETGNPLWQSEIVTTPGELTLDLLRDQIYIPAQEQITAISASTGKTIWINQAEILRKNSPPVRLLSDGTIVAYARQEGIRFVDPANGELSRPIDLPIGTFLYYENNAFVYSGFGIIRCIDSKTNEIIWVSEKLFDEGTLSTEDLRPDVQGDLLILRANSSLDKPIVLDRNTGQEVWRSGTYSIASNIAIEKSLLYMVTADAELMIVDVESNNIIGTVKFSPLTSSRQLYSQNGIGGSWVAIDKGFIAIYFHDLDILSVYRIKFSPLPYN